MQTFVKYALLGISLTTGLMAVLVLGHLITSPSGTIAWIAVRFIAATFVVAATVTTWFLLARDRRGLRTEVFVAGAGLVALGAAALVNAYYGTITTGDAEYWVFLLDGALLAQGLGTLGYLWWRFALDPKQRDGR